MSLKKTYVDSGVLINAFRGTKEVSIKATQVLDDPQRKFASSPFVQLETLPKAIIAPRLLRLLHLPGIHIERLKIALNNGGNWDNDFEWQNSNRIFTHERPWTSFTDFKIT